MDSQQFFHNKIKFAPKFVFQLETGKNNIMSWFKKIFNKKEKQVKQFPRSAQSYGEYLDHIRILDDQEFYDLYFNHPPIENYLHDSDSSVMNKMEIPESSDLSDRKVDDSFGHGASFGSGEAAASWDDHSYAPTISWSAKGSGSGNYDSGSSDHSSNDGND